MRSKAKRIDRTVANLPSIPKELVSQFLTGPMTGEAINAARAACEGPSGINREIGGVTMLSCVVPSRDACFDGGSARQHQIAGPRPARRQAAATRSAGPAASSGFDPAGHRRRQSRQAGTDEHAL